MDYDLFLFPALLLWIEVLKMIWKCWFWISGQKFLKTYSRVKEKTDFTHTYVYWPGLSQVEAEDGSWVQISCTGDRDPAVRASFLPVLVSVLLRSWNQELESWELNPGTLIWGRTYLKPEPSLFGCLAVWLNVHPFSP